MCFFEFCKYYHLREKGLLANDKHKTKSLQWIIIQEWQFYDENDALISNTAQAPVDLDWKPKVYNTNKLALLNADELLEPVFVFVILLCNANFLL